MSEHDRTEIEKTGRTWDGASRALDRAEARERAAVEEYIKAKEASMALRNLGGRR
jgi:hypothetical protein